MSSDAPLRPPPPDVSQMKLVDDEVVYNDASSSVFQSGNMRNPSNKTHRQQREAEKRNVETKFKSLRSYKHLGMANPPSQQVSLG